jgi:hypothetical protein
MKIKFLHSLIALFCLLLAVPSPAATYAVTNLNDSGPGTLRTLIAGSAANDTILCAIPGTIALTSGELAITHNLAITGPGATNLTVSAPGAYSGRVFHILGGTVSISGLTISGGGVAGADGTSASRGGGNGEGGGIFNSGTLTLTNCTVTQNFAQGGNGFADNSDNAIGNGGGGYGGGIYNDNSGSLTLVNCLVANNVARGGGGGITTNVISYGLGGGGGGGGVFSSGTVCGLAGCTLFNNDAIGGGGAGGGPGDGGGISVHDGLLVNCTIVTNLAEYGGADGGSGSGSEGDANGGGVEAATTGSTGVTINSCTIQGNQAVSATGSEASGGGLAVFNNAPLTLENTIVSGNSTLIYFADSGGWDVSGTVTSGGYNFIGQTDGTSAGWVASDQTGTTVTPIDPQLGPLQDNGGPTFTLALPATSPAVNQGKSFGLTTDQRGLPRPFSYPGVASAAGGDGSDIGAYELSFARPILHVKMIYEPYPLVEISYANDPSFPGSPIFPGEPIFGLQVLTNGLNPGANAWTDLQTPLRLIDGQYVTRDRVVQKGPGQNLGTVGSVYRGSTTVTNLPFVSTPVTLQASNVTPSTATLDGNDISIGGDTVYWFQYGYTTSYGQNTPTNTLATSSNPTLVTAAIGGLLSLEQYHCQLVVSDDWGTQYGGDTSFTTPGYPPAVVTSVATSITTTSAVLNGTVDDNGTGMAGYFEYGTYQNNGPPCCTPPPALVFLNSYQFYGPGNFSVQSFSVTVSNLAPSTTYYFCIVAYNGVGESIGFTNTFNTGNLPPPAVVTLAASSVATNSAVLNGSVDSSNENDPDEDPTAYFEWGTTTSYGNYTMFNGISIVSPDYTANLAGLTPSTTYHYRIDALDSGGTSLGADVSFTTPWLPLAPTLVTPGTSTDTGYQVPGTQPIFTWDDISQATSYGIVVRNYPSGSVVYQQTGLTGNTFAMPSGQLVVEGQYSWTMTSFNSVGDQSAPSGALIFQVER